MFLSVSCITIARAESPCNVHVKISLMTPAGLSSIRNLVFLSSAKAYPYGAQPPSYSPFSCFAT